MSAAERRRDEIDLEICACLDKPRYGRGMSQQETADHINANFKGANVTRNGVNGRFLRIMAQLAKSER